MNAYLRPIAIASLLLASLLAVPVSQAASQLETTISVYNDTQNADGARVPAKPGDILTYTMTLRNLGPDDLIDYEPQANVEDLLPLGEIIQYGNGGIFEDNIFITYPPILQSATCDCEDEFTFTYRLDSEICIDNRIVTTAFPIVVFEDSGVGININCDPAPAPTPAPTPVAPVEVPESGPAAAAMLALAAAGSLGVRRMLTHRS